MYALNEYRSWQGEYATLASFLHSHLLPILTAISHAINCIGRPRTTIKRRRAVRSVTEIIRLTGSTVSAVSAQVIALLQDALDVSALRADALDAWNAFMETLSADDMGPILNTFCLSICKSHEEFTGDEMRKLLTIYESIFIHNPDKYTDYYDSLCLLPDKPPFRHINRIITEHQGPLDVTERIRRLLPSIAHDHAVVARRALCQLRTILIDATDLHTYILGDTVHQSIVDALSAVLKTCRRYNGTDADIPVLCCECLGALGAIDPSRLDLALAEEPGGRPILDGNGVFSLQQALDFACALIETKLAAAFRSAPSAAINFAHAYAIQSLLEFSGFKSKARSSAADAQEEEKDQQLNRTFSKDVLVTIKPLLKATYTARKSERIPPQTPLFQKMPTFTEWVTTWAEHLIDQCHGKYFRSVFQRCRESVRRDVNIATYILPHLVLNILVAGDVRQKDVMHEEFVTVLQCGDEPDLVALEKWRLGSQLIFSLMDHLSTWLRRRRQAAARQKAALARRQGRYVNAEEPAFDSDPSVQQISAFLERIPEEVGAAAAYRSKAYARALRYFERHIRREQETKDATGLQPLYEHLQKIYAHLDEPDGMAGIATKLLTPSLEQQILEHESTGDWAAAQTCYELLLQREPDVLDHHIGYISCLRNLGHFETLLIYLKGITARNPQWAEKLNSFAVETTWRLGNWAQFEALMTEPYEARFETELGRLIHRGHKGDKREFRRFLEGIRRGLTAELAASSMESYRRAYDCNLKLHMLHEVETIFTPENASATGDLESLLRLWQGRLKATMPSFRVQGPILNLRRILLHPLKGNYRFSFTTHEERLIQECGRIWLQSAKLSRRAGHLQPAYSAMLQAANLGAPHAHLEKAKLLCQQNQIQKAMFELQTVLKATHLEAESKAKVITVVIASFRNGVITIQQTQLRLARWVEESRGGSRDLRSMYEMAYDILPSWEKGPFFLGRYCDKLFMREYEQLKHGVTAKRSQQMARHAADTCQYYGQALRNGTRYIYQTLPRLLTIWFEFGTLTQSDSLAEPSKALKSMTDGLAGLAQKLPAYQFLTAIPQLSSRIGHNNEEVHSLLESILVNILCAYPHQTLWQLVAVSRSSNGLRASRMKKVFNRAKGQEAEVLVEQLLGLCNYKLQPRETTLSVSKHFRNMERKAPLHMIVPLQSTMTVSLPSESNQGLSMHRPFPAEAPKIQGFRDEIEVMNSLQRPRKLTIKGSDGREYIFLCKPKDDLRKDCRLMEFNSLINKLLKKDPEARRRRLYVRTYAVIPLNEECGLIEWVRNTVGFRHIMIAGYRAKNTYMQIMERKHVGKDKKVRSITDVFIKEIKPRFPPVFHEWFLDTFLEPTKWFSSRLAYASTTAVMSMVGYVVGLGDRHGENILFDDQTGDCVHVDLNCLFDKGATFEVPERVPFRLTHNMVDAFGVTGVEGVFRRSCEITLRVLRNNRESLMSVLETFLYDPLCEWSNKASKKGSSADPQGEVENEQAVKTLHAIDRKLQGYMLSVEGQVHQLIQEATDESRLAAMYIGTVLEVPS
ncbi:hypothetical protein BC832DRAFT_531539 [Gaertneriomyces semiglobifer]|nr:hypothetical protein BC832DRAFT_531539 [Gaertneriomyces semiglobifer]